MDQVAVSGALSGVYVSWLVLVSSKLDRDWMIRSLKILGIYWVGVLSCVLLPPNLRFLQWEMFLVFLLALVLFRDRLDFQKHWRYGSKVGYGVFILSVVYAFIAWLTVGKEGARDWFAFHSRNYLANAVFIFAVVAPISEELIFRHFLGRGGRFIWIEALTGSILFGLMHSFYESRGLIGTAILILGSIGLYRISSKWGLMSSVIAHALYNLTLVLIARYSG